MSRHISKIFYINLDKRIDRHAEIEEELRSHGLVGERFSAHYHPMGFVGCTHSHLDVLKIAQERDYANVLILEDDFEFLVSQEEMENAFEQLFSGSTLGPNFDVCKLSYSLCESEELPETPFLTRVLFSQTSSGYLINRHYYDTLINVLENALPILEQTGQHWLYTIDQAWHPLQKRDRWVCFTQRLGKQRSGFSDNSQCYVDYTF